MNMKMLITLKDGTQVQFDQEEVPEELRGFNISSVVFLDDDKPNDPFGLVPWKPEIGIRH